jgi:hypothetical protein
MLEIKKYVPSDLVSIEKMDAFAATEIQLVIIVRY